MPLKCHICQLLHVQVWDNYDGIYTLYELTAINNVTRSTGMHAFHIIGICPSTNTSATLHKYFSLHFYCSLHINPTLVHTSIKISKLQHFFTIVLLSVCRQQICLSSTACKATYPNYFMFINGSSMPIYVQHTNSPHFTSLAYAPQQIHLPHYTYIFHCTSTVVCI